ncbi:PREDICTED: potassium/sodium hyperpolarization-activated cyclic nucleotide-gated channel 2-like [Dinoponera quadriceps]|uniref:Potassium/sodium hyperpolarization-activated cyclic nucleotide-gated channel 2-like n=1 Tax=Dinoponera quadriceps TaxID=609295 RepID=A0A6P3YE11_DINQU|nr:PREDICTED: potassium/sodium hyperpolarization-activated cyclic nucleotide-gated channel 2-like [Dinoponera quadriceps]
MATDLNISRKQTNLHICDLPKSSNSNLPKLPPNAKFYSRWRRRLQKLVLVSARHPLTRSVLRSQAAIAFEKRRHARSPHRWVIHPFSMLRIGKNSGPERWNIVYPVYTLCIIDIFLNFMTGFVSSDGHEIFLDAALVARHYVRRYFFVDLFTSIPYTWLYPWRILPSGPDSNSALLIIEFLPILKIIHMLSLRHNIQQISEMCGIPRTKKTTIWLVIITLLILHWSGCISYIFPYIVKHVKGKPMMGSDTYYISTKLYTKPIWKIYLIFVHIGVSNLIGSSSIEFENFGILDRMIRCVLLLCGKGYIIYLIVTILQLLESSAEPELKYQRIMHQVNEYIHQKRLPRYLKDKLTSYYEYRYQGSFFKEIIISDTLSNHLNREILFHNSRRLMNNAILRNLTHNVLGDLMSLLKPVIYLEEDVIYKAGTESDCMYFIASGTVVLITFSGKEICHLHDGDHFGETVLICPDRSRTESVIALEVCELLRLDRRDFKCLFPPKSEFYANMKQIAQERLQKIKKLDESGRFNEGETT